MCTNAFEQTRGLARASAHEEEEEAEKGRRVRGGEERPGGTESHSLER